jgi:hypothetical protein
MRSTHLSSTRRTVRALRRAGLLGDEHAALVRLALTAAEELDRYISSDVARYVVVQLTRTHLELLRQLDQIGKVPAPVPAPIEQCEPAAPEYALLLDELARPL